MENKSKPGRLYFISVLLLTLILPLSSVIIDSFVNKNRTGLYLMAGKWFIFWAVGMRLFIAGVKQVTDPSFTAKNIFHVEDKDCHIIVRELGFANICFGILGIISLFVPQWRVVSAFVSGLFYGIAGFNHIIKKPASANEMIALVSDVFIFLLLCIYLLTAFEPASF